MDYSTANEYEQESPIKINKNGSFGHSSAHSSAFKPVNYTRNRSNSYLAGGKTIPPPGRPPVESPQPNLASYFQPHYHSQQQQQQNPSGLPQRPQYEPPPQRSQPQKRVDTHEREPLYKSSYRYHDNDPEYDRNSYHDSREYGYFRDKIGPLPPSPPIPGKRSNITGYKYVEKYSEKRRIGSTSGNGNRRRDYEYEYEYDQPRRRRDNVYTKTIPVEYSKYVDIPRSSRYEYQTSYHSNPRNYEDYDLSYIDGNYVQVNIELITFINEIINLVIILGWLPYRLSRILFFVKKKLPTSSHANFYELNSNILSLYN